MIQVSASSQVPARLWGTDQQGMSSADVADADLDADDSFMMAKLVARLEYTGVGFGSGQAQVN